MIINISIIKATGINRLNYLLFALFILLFCSCEGRTGYYDSDQQEIIALLTEKDWKLVYEHVPGFEPNELREEGWIYKFNANGTGSYKWVRWDDGSINEEPVYFRWTFTTDNFATIYIDKSARFLLIDRLTSSELWVHNSYKDPVLHPSSEEILWKFTAWQSYQDHGPF